MCWFDVRAFSQASVTYHPTIKPAHQRHLLYMSHRLQQADVFGARSRIVHVLGLCLWLLGEFLLVKRSVCLPEGVRLHLLFLRVMSDGSLSRHTATAFPPTRLLFAHTSVVVHMIIFTCTHLESLAEQGSKPILIMKICCWSSHVFNQRIQRRNRYAVSQRWQ